MHPGGTTVFTGCAGIFTGAGSIPERLRQECIIIKTWLIDRVNSTMRT